MRSRQPVHVRHAHHPNSIADRLLHLVPVVAIMLFGLSLVSTPRITSSMSSPVVTSFTAAQSSNDDAADGTERPGPVAGTSQTEATQTFTGTASLRSWTSEEIGAGTTPVVSRFQPTATPLLGGSVLIVGGYQSPPGPETDPAAASAELYDPIKGTFRMTGQLVQPRFDHTATRLRDGRVLITGGFEYNALNSAEIYNPKTRTFSATDAMSHQRTGHTATLLPDGRVLIVGGDDVDPLTSTAEIYDPATGTFSTTGSLQRHRKRHSATLLSDGRVLVAGGTGTSNFNAEIYDPVTGSWTTTGTMQEERDWHTATLLNDGRVLFVGGFDNGSSAELYDPATESFTATGSMSQPGRGHMATLQPDGTVVIIATNGSFIESPVHAEIYDPTRGVFTASGTMIAGDGTYAAAPLTDGTVLVVGGARAEIYDPETGTFTDTSRKLEGQRYEHTATRLRDGRVLIVGGRDNINYTYADTRVYDPATTLFSASGAMRESRSGHTATLLPNGKFLVAGGARTSGSLGSAELYDPAKGAFTVTGSMMVPRVGHTATLLKDGRVLITGGVRTNDNGVFERHRSAEIYNPVTGRFTAVGSMHAERYSHTATLLADGSVLIVGGSGPGYLEHNSAELYNPITRTFSTTGALATARYGHTATRLKDGTVLIAGGINNSTILASAEVYDPARRTFRRAPSMVQGRYLHHAILMDDGVVLFTGGHGSTSSILEDADVEVYDPGPQTFMVVGVTVGKSPNHTATMLDDGTVLIVGGTTGLAEVGKLRIKNTFTGALTLPTGWVSTATPIITVTGSTTGTLLMDGSVNNGPWFKLQPGVAAATTARAFTDGSDQPVVLRLRATTGRAIVVVRGNIDVDSTAPQSTMTPLPPTSPTLMTLEWSGTDKTSGVAGYDVEVRQGTGGAWTRILSNTTALTTTFTGEAGGTYQFRVRARDLARNVEAWPASFDTSTKVQAATATPTRTTSPTSTSQPTASPTETASPTATPTRTTSPTSTNKPTASSTRTTSPTATVRATGTTEPARSRVFLPSISR